MATDTNSNMEINIEAQNDTQNGFDSLNSALESFQNTIEKLTSSFDAFSNSINNSMDNASRSMEDFAGHADESVSSVENASQTASEDIVKNFDDAAQKSGQAMEDMAKKTEEGFGSIKSQMDMMFAGMSFQSISEPLDNAIEKSAENFSTFDQSMRLVNEEAKLSQTGFQNLENQIISLSNQTGMSADDLSKGLYNVVATGLTDTTKAMNELQVAAEGAKAGNTDLNTSTKALNAVMGAYGMNASQASHIMDVMFTAVNNGQMHFQDLATSVGASATSAATAGVKYEELAAAQATLTNVGKNAESASQNLNSLIMGMIAPTSAATKEAKSLGIEWDAAALKSKGLTGMINEAVTATKGNEAELKKLVPNQRAYVAVLALGQNANKQYTQTLEQMKNSSGATSKALEEYSKGSEESIDKAKTSIQNAGMELIVTLAPAITTIAEDITKLVDWFNKLSPTTKTIIADFLIGTAVFTTVAGKLFMLGAGLAALVAVFGTAAAPIGIFILAIAGIATVATLIMLNWKPISSFFSGIYNSMSGGAKSAFESIESAASTKFIEAKNAISSSGASIKASASNAFEGAKNSVVSALNGMKNESSNILDGMHKAITSKFLLTTVWSNDIFTNFRNATAKIFDAMKVSTLGSVLLLCDGIVGLFTGDFTKLREDLNKIHKRIYDDITGAWNSIKSACSSLSYTLTWDVQNDWDNFKTTLFSTSDNIKQGIINKFNETVSWFEALPGRLYNAGANMFTSMRNGASSTLTSLENTVKNGFNGAVNYLESLPERALQWGEDFINGFVNGVENKIDSVVNAVSDVADSIRSYLHFSVPDIGPLSDANTYGPDMIELISNGMTGNLSKLKAAASNVAQVISGSLNPSVAVGSVAVQGNSAVLSNNSLVDNIVQALKPAQTSNTTSITNNNGQGELYLIMDGEAVGKVVNKRVDTTQDTDIKLRLRGQGKK